MVTNDDIIAGIIPDIMDGEIFFVKSNLNVNTSVPINEKIIAKIITHIT